MKCTWAECTKAATQPQLDAQKREWANLCDVHHALLNEAIDSADAKRMIGAYIKANGGAEGMMHRMKPEIETTQKLATLLTKTEEGR